MRRDASDGLADARRAPDPGDADPGLGRARSGRRHVGLPIPSRGLMGLIALAIIGMMALARDDPGRGLPPTRLIPGEPGMMALEFALSPDGKWIAKARSDGRVSLQPVGASRRILDPRGAEVSEGPGLLARRPDPGRGAGRARHPPLRRRWGWIADHLEHTVIHVPRPRFSAGGPDPRLVATRRDGEILLWNLASDRLRTRLRGLYGLAIAFSPDGRTLAAGERDEKRVTLWDLETGRSRSILKERFGEITSVAFSPDGGLLAAAGPTDRLVRLWDPASGRLRRRIPGHAFGTNSVRFSPDGGLLITAGSDGMVRIWRVETGELVASLDGRTSVLPQVFLCRQPDADAAAGSDDDIRIWDLDEIDAISSLADQRTENHRFKVTVPDLRNQSSIVDAVS